MGTLQAFILKHAVRMADPDWAESNPNIDGDDKWAKEATHWKCVLRCGRRRMTVHFSQGAAHIGPPDLKSVLDCLASDAASVDNAGSFTEWAAELGYDADSRKAERIFNAIEKQAHALHGLLGDEAYRTLLYETERL